MMQDFTIAEMKEGYLAEDKDVVGTAPPDASDNKDEKKGGVKESEVEEDGSGQEPEDGVDELPYHEDGLRLHLVRVVNLTRRQHSQPKTCIRDKRKSSRYIPGADIHSYDMHGVPWTLCEVSETCHLDKVW